MIKKYYMPFDIMTPDWVKRPEGVKGVMVVYKTRKHAEEAGPDKKIWVIEVDTEEVLNEPG
jgi:hypothetical protein